MELRLFSNNYVISSWQFVSPPFNMILGINKHESDSIFSFISDSSFYLNTNLYRVLSTISELFVRMF